MEPIAANSGITTQVRPTIALQGDLPSMLKEGRVLSGEVMQTMDGSSLLLAIGEHKVPADAQVDLQAGQKFRAQVILKDGKLALQLISDTYKISEPALLRALRSLIGRDQPIASLLGELSGGLVENGASATRTRLEVMLQQLGTKAPTTGTATPPTGGETPARSPALEHLAAELRGGLVTRAKQAGLPAPAPEVLAAFGADLAVSLERAAETVANRPARGPLTPQAFADIAQRFGQELIDALHARPQEPAREFLIQGLERAGVASLVQHREGALLAVLLHAGAFADDEGAAQVARPQNAEVLFSKLQQSVFQPGSSGEQLRQTLEPSGFGYENALLASASSRGVDNVESALKNLANELRAKLVQVPVEARPPEGVQIERVLGEALERAVKALGAERVKAPLTRAGFEGLARSFEREVVRALRAQSATPERDAAIRVIESLPKGELVRGRESALVRALLAGEGKLASSLIQAATAAVGGDTRGQLLEALLAGGLGTARAAVSSALGGLELQHILNMARHDTGEALHWSFPVPDGGGWTTADMFLDPQQGGRGGDAEQNPEDASFRFVVGVDFSALGPVRADVLLAPGALTIRLMVSDPDLSIRIRGDVAELSEYLAFGGRKVQVAVVLGTERELDVGALARDIRFLRENRLMDVEG